MAGNRPDPVGAVQRLASFGPGVQRRDHREEPGGAPLGAVPGVTLRQSRDLPQLLLRQALLQGREQGHGKESLIQKPCKPLFLLSVVTLSTTPILPLNVS